MLDPVPILLYHAVTTDPPEWIAPFAVSPQTFSAHLDVVQSSGRQPVTVSQYFDGLRGKVQLPARPVVITVDDGFADFASNALPALIDRKIPSTLYVTTGSLADRDYECVLPPAHMLRTADLPQLEAIGVEIGAHSHTHRQLDLLSEDALSFELSRNLAVLVNTLGHGIRSFAYPHGYWSKRTRRLIAKTGFDSACAVGNAMNVAEDHPLSLSRLMVRADTELSTIRMWMSASKPTMSGRRRVLAYGWRQYRRMGMANQRDRVSRV